MSDLDVYSDFIQDVDMMINSLELIYAKSIRCPRFENLSTVKTTVHPFCKIIQIVYHFKRNISLFFIAVINLDD